MAFDFSTRRPRPAMSRGTILRMGSLVMGLILVIGLMQSISSPRTVAQLGTIFGNGEAESRPTLTSAQQVEVEDLLAQVDQTLLEVLDDDKPFRPAETEAWYHLLVLARETPAEQLRQATVGPITYAQLLSQPDAYRGHVVSITGVAHRIESLPQDTNEHGISHVYEVIVQPGGTGKLPVTLHCLELPAGFETLDSPRPIRFDGFFFKNRVYGHVEGLDKTPVIIGKSFEPLDTSSASASDAAGPSVVRMVLIVGVVALLTGLLLRQALTLPKPLPRGGATPDDDPTKVAATLRQLEAQAEATEPTGAEPPEGESPV